MQTTPSFSQMLSRAALAAIAVVVVLAVGDLSERQFGLQMPPAIKGAIKGIVLFMAFFVMNLIPFRQPNKSQQPASAPDDARA